MNPPKSFLYENFSIKSLSSEFPEDITADYTGILGMVLTNIIRVSIGHILSQIIRPLNVSGQVSVIFQSKLLILLFLLVYVADPIANLPSTSLCVQSGPKSAKAV